MCQIVNLVTVGILVYHNKYFAFSHYIIAMYYFEEMLCLEIVFIFTLFITVMYFYIVTYRMLKNKKLQ